MFNDGEGAQLDRGGSVVRPEKDCLHSKSKPSWLLVRCSGQQRQRALRHLPSANRSQIASPRWRLTVCGAETCSTPNLAGRSSVRRASASRGVFFLFVSCSPTFWAAAQAIKRIPAMKNKTTRLNRNSPSSTRLTRRQIL